MSVNLFARIHTLKVRELIESYLYKLTKIDGCKKCNIHFVFDPLFIESRPVDRFEASIEINVAIFSFILLVL